MEEVRSMEGLGRCFRSIWLDALEDAMWLGWQFDTDCVASAYWATGDDDAHDPGFPNELTVLRSIQHR